MNNGQSLQTPKMCMGTGRIHGLKSTPWYFSHRCFWALSLGFTKVSNFSIKDMTYIKAGDNEDEAEAFCQNLKDNFKRAGIQEGDSVKIIFYADYGNNVREGQVRAICSTKNELCIDAADKFKVKPFKELGLTIAP